MLSKTLKFIAGLLFISLSIVGCTVETPTSNPVVSTSTLSVAATPLPTDIPQPSVTPSFTPEPTNTATPTSTHTPTSTPTLTPTITPTPLPIGVVSVDNVNFRTGPGAVYPSVFAVTQGTEFIILGQSEDGLWYYAELEDGQQGWVLVTSIIVNTPNLALAIVEAPPTPILPSATPGHVPAFTVSDSYRGPGYFAVQFKHFPPNDSCRLDVFDQSGKKVYTHLYNLDETGNRTHSAKIIKGTETYTFVIQCESGISAQATYSKR